MWYLWGRDGFLKVTGNGALSGTAILTPNSPYREKIKSLSGRFLSLRVFAPETSAGKTKVKKEG
jgi:hypothetical protein